MTSSIYHGILRGISGTICAGLISISYPFPHSYRFRQLASLNMQTLGLYGRITGEGVAQKGKRLLSDIQIQTQCVIPTSIRLRPNMHHTVASSSSADQVAQTPQNGIEERKLITGYQITS